MKRFLLIGVVLGSLATALATLSCSSGGYPGKLESLTVANVPAELNALFYIAEAREHYAQNGLQVILKEEYDSGATAVAGLLNGEADIALTAEFPIVREVFNKKSAINLGTIAKYENTYIIWRAGSGINTIKDLKGKRIGVTLSTISEFYLGRTLELNGVNIEQVTLVGMKAAEAENYLVGGEVDAVVTWSPWVAQINQSMGKEVTTKAVQSGQYAYWNMVSTADWINNHTDSMKRLLKALAQAENYLASNREDAMAIVRKRMNFDVIYMENPWQTYQFSLSLDQSLILAMEDEARWMMQNNLTAERQMPDFRAHIYIDGLKAAKPEAVNIR